MNRLRDVLHRAQANGVAVGHDFPIFLNADILLEGEIGDIGSGSEIHREAVPQAANLTTPQEARQFVEPLASIFWLRRSGTCMACSPA